MANDTYERFSQICADVQECDKDVVVAMFSKAMKALTDVSPKLASNILETYEGMLNYDNYVTEEEAEKIVSSMVGSDGSHGAKWKDHDYLFRKLDSLSIPKTSEHIYNEWAMYVTINMISSDYGEIISEISNGDANAYFELCAKLALARLEDVDSPCNIRRYFMI